MDIQLPGRLCAVVRSFAYTSIGRLPVDDGYNAFAITPPADVVSRGRERIRYSAAEPGSQFDHSNLPDS
jgi:hypothetical protein